MPGPERNARSDPGKAPIAKKTGQVLPCPVLTLKISALFEGRLI
jgi:hypothetical protein